MTKQQIKERLVKLLFNKNHSEVKEWVFKSDDRASKVADLIDEVSQYIFDYYDTGCNTDEELQESTAVFINLTKLEDDLTKFFMMGGL